MRWNIRGLAATAALTTGSLLALVAACAERAEPTSPAPSGVEHVHLSAAAHAPIDRATRRQLRELRKATKQYHDFARAQTDGYTVKVTDCLENAERGGMGYHYAREALIDGEVLPLAPEVLLYEPAKSGRLRLVGVEFIIPFTAWTASQPPVLFGQTFARNETFQVWALHAWIWRTNPSGVFADWNPKVTCARDNT